MTELVQDEQWARLWQLATMGPPGRSRALLLRLQDQGWRPAAAEQEALTTLSQSAARCAGPAPLYSRVGAETSVPVELGPITYNYCRTDEPEKEAQQLFRKCVFWPEGQFIVLSICQIRQYRSQDRLQQRFVKSLVETFTGRPYPTSIDRLRVSRDGGRLAVADHAGAVQVWQLPEARLLASPAVPALANLIFVNEEKLIVAAAATHETKVIAKDIQIWDLQSGRLVNTIRLQGDWRHLTANAPGNLLAGYHWDEGQICVWRLPEGEVISTLAYKRYSFQTDLRLDPSGKLLVAGGGPYSELRLWSLPEAGAPTQLGRERAGKYVAINSDGRLLAGSDGKEIKVWSLPEGRLVWQSRPLSGIRALFFSPDGTGLFAAGDEIYRWQIETWPLSDIPLAVMTPAAIEWALEKHRFEHTPASERAWFEFVTALTYWGRGDEALFRRTLNQQLLAGPVPAAVRKIIAAGGIAPSDPQQRALTYFLTEQWAKHEALDFDYAILRTMYAAFEDEARRRIRRLLRRAGRADLLTVIVGQDYVSQARSMTAAETEFVIDMLAGRQEWAKLWRLAFEVSLAGSLCIVRTLAQNRWQPEREADRTVYQTLVSLAGEPMLDSDQSEQPAPAVHRARTAVPGRINDLAFSPHRPLIAVGTGSGKVVLWNFETARSEWLYQAERAVGRVAFTPADTLLFAERSGRNDAPSSVYRGDRNGDVHRLGRHTGPITTLRSVAADRFLTAGRDGQAMLWNETGLVRQITVSSADWPRRACISPDGRRAAILTGRALALYALPDLIRLDHHQKKGQVFRQAIFADDETLVLGQGQAVLIAPCGPDGSLAHSEEAPVEHLAPVEGIEMLANRSILITADAAGQLNFTRWPHLTAAIPLQVPGERLTSLHVSADGAFMAVGDTDASISLWDLRSLSLSFLLRQPLGRARPVDLPGVLALLNRSDLTPEIRNTVHYLAAVLRYRFRYDIELEAGPEIMAGEFDIELDSDA